MTITTMGRYRFYSDLPVTILLNKITHCAHQLKLQTYNVYQQNFNIKTKKKKNKKKKKNNNKKRNKKKKKKKKKNKKKKKKKKSFSVGGV